MRIKACAYSNRNKFEYSNQTEVSNSQNAHLLKFLPRLPDLAFQNSQKLAYRKQDWLEAFPKQTGYFNFGKSINNLYLYEFDTCRIENGRRWVTLDPLHESAQRALMTVYELSRQHAAALRQYETCTRLLKVELGAEPEEETAVK